MIPELSFEGAFNVMYKPNPPLQLCEKSERVEKVTWGQLYDLNNLPIATLNFMWLQSLFAYKYNMITLMIKPYYITKRKLTIITPEKYVQELFPCFNHVLSSFIQGVSKNGNRTLECSKAFII